MRRSSGNPRIVLGLVLSSELGNLVGGMVTEFVVDRRDLRCLLFALVCAGLGTLLQQGFREAGWRGPKRNKEVIDAS